MALEIMLLSLALIQSKAEKEIFSLIRLVMENSIKGKASALVQSRMEKISVENLSLWTSPVHMASSRWDFGYRGNFYLLQNKWMWFLNYISNFEFTIHSIDLSSLGHLKKDYFIMEVTYSPKFIVLDCKYAFILCLLAFYWCNRKTNQYFTTQSRFNAVCKLNIYTGTQGGSPACSVF